MCIKFELCKKPFRAEIGGRSLLMCRVQQSCSAERGIFSSEGQAELVGFALSGRGVCMSECDMRVRIPLGKSSYNTTSVMQSCVKDFLGKKMVDFFQV